MSTELSGDMPNPSIPFSFLQTTKLRPSHIPAFLGTSTQLVPTSVPALTSPRSYYLAHPTSPPVLSAASFLPRSLIPHLMRHKKRSAVGVKFLSSRSPPDAITNVEGALHTFLIPVLPAFVHGDYIYRTFSGHSVARFPLSPDRTQQARPVILSALIQPDFETPDVLLAVCALADSDIRGAALPDDFAILDTASKQDPALRRAYDDSLRRHLIYHLTGPHTLPSLSSVASKTMTPSSAINFLSTLPSVSSISATYVALSRNTTISLEILLAICTCAFDAELSALEAVAPQGYVYTFDPAAIFAAEIGALLLNRIQICAFREALLARERKRLRVFAFNDYADVEAVELLKRAFAGQGVQVVSKKELFGTDGFYCPAEGLNVHKALLVVHNNSDAFGQNIETEGSGGSLDGTLGEWSSAAGSLRRDREDLLDFLM